jgi:hypothetical protein
MRCGCGTSPNPCLSALTDYRMQLAHGSRAKGANGGAPSLLVAGTSSFSREAACPWSPIVSAWNVGVSELATQRQRPRL